MSMHPDTATASPVVFPCPRCQQPSHWQDNPHRPFCSARCQVVDLGAWASENYRIAAEEHPLSDDLAQDTDPSR